MGKAVDIKKLEDRRKMLEKYLSNPNIKSTKNTSKK